MADENVISEGDMVVIQRLNYLRSHKIASAKASAKKPHPGPPRVQIGRETVDLQAALGQPYGTAFRMVRKTHSREWELQPVSLELVQREEDKVSGEASNDAADAQAATMEEEGIAGRDNRNLQDDGG